jgi:hypothetical protein
MAFIVAVCFFKESNAPWSEKHFFSFEPVSNTYSLLLL